MITTIYNFKGGVGKTSLSVNIDLYTDAMIITNDPYAPLENIFDESRLYKTEIGADIPIADKDSNVIYDLGGYPDQRAISVLEVSDLVIIPIAYDSDTDFQPSVNAINEIQNHNQNILIVINNTASKEQAEVSEALEEFFDYPIMYIKSSKALRRAVREGKSISTIMQEKPLFKHAYTPVHVQFELLIEKINTYTPVSEVA